MFLSIHADFRIDWKRKRVSEIEWHILTLPLMMPQPMSINDNRFMRNSSCYFSSVNFSKTLSRYTFFKPMCIVKDLLRERRIFQI